VILREFMSVRTQITRQLLLGRTEDKKSFRLFSMLDEVNYVFRA